MGLVPTFYVRGRRRAYPRWSGTKIMEHREAAISDMPPGGKFAMIRERELIKEQKWAHDNVCPKCHMVLTTTRRCPMGCPA